MSCSLCVANKNALQSVHEGLTESWCVSPAESTAVTVTVTTPAGFDARATVMKMGSLQTDTGSHESGETDVTSVLFPYLCGHSQTGDGHASPPGAGANGQGHLERNRDAWVRA